MAKEEAWGNSRVQEPVVGVSSCEGGARTGAQDCGDDMGTGCRQGEGERERREDGSLRQIGLGTDKAVVIRMHRALQLRPAGFARSLAVFDFL